MATNFARRGTQKDLTPEDAKAQVLLHIQAGLTIEEACKLVNRSTETYRKWRREDAIFRGAVDEIRKVRAENEDGKPELPPFDVFCRDWLKQPLYPHQLRLWDVIEGRQPRDLHESMTFEQGYANRIIANLPPDHAKTTTFTVNYTVYSIHKNPDVRVVLMSQGRNMAERFLGEIKFKLTSPLYREMHMKFAPEGGWKDPDGSWTNTAIYVRGKSGDKDPTVQALGLRGQIYGARSDMIFLDDVITTKNAREIESQEIFLNREVESRLPPDQEGGGLLAILGTRVAPQDLYRHLKDVRDGDDERVWTYFRQPAVLDYGDGDSKTWITLWPERYDGKSLARRRRDGNWNLIYQQLDIDDDMTFKAEAVMASVNNGRFPGPMTPQGRFHRDGGMDGLYVVGGLDPATSGKTAMMVVGLDRSNGKRWVLDGYNENWTTPQQRDATMKRFTEMYGINEWVIETNAHQRSIVLDVELMNWFRSRGVRVEPHYTTADKYDADWGIPTMAPLFDSCAEPDPKRPGLWKQTPRDQHLIELPSTRQNAWVNELVQQLTVWQPAGMAQKQKTDLVMALWFTHIACSRIMNKKRERTTHMASPFLTPAAKSRQAVIDLAELRRQRREGIA